MSPWSPWSILPRMKVKEYLRDYHPLRCIRYRKRLNRYIHASQDSEGNFCFVSVNINKVSRYLKLLVKLPAKKKPHQKTNDHQTSSLLPWQNSSVEINFSRQSAFQKCEQVTDIEFHTSAVADTVDYHLLCSGLWYWSQSLLPVISEMCIIYWLKPWY